MILEIIGVRVLTFIKYDFSCKLYCIKLRQLLSYVYWGKIGFDIHINSAHRKGILNTKGRALSIDDIVRIFFFETKWCKHSSRNSKTGSIAPPPPPSIPPSEKNRSMPRFCQQPIHLFVCMWEGGGISLNRIRIEKNKKECIENVFSASSMYSVYPLYWRRNVFIKEPRIPKI